MGTAIFGLLLVSILALIAVKYICEFLEGQGIALPVWVQVVLFLLIVLAFVSVPLNTPARHVFASL